MYRKASSLSWKTPRGSRMASLVGAEAGGCVLWVALTTETPLKLHLVLGSSFRTLQIVSRTNDFLSGRSRLKEEEPERISEMGKPILGQHSRLEVIVEESSEIKVCEQLKESFL